MTLLLMSYMIIACNYDKQEITDPMQAGPSQVEMKQVDGKYRLFVNGEEFFVKGAGCENGPCGEIAIHGGNSFRTWTIDNGQQTGREKLDMAWENGLMVMMGLNVGNERHGFDYNDKGAVAQQLERLRQEVLELKDHPALLGWGIGNELNLNYSNQKVWDAVNDIARMIKEVDGNHVTTTMLAGIYKKEVDYILEHCPDVDFISIQLYGSLIDLEQRLENAGYNGPYLVTEWGATGHWEVPQTEWGSAIEQTSTEKAEAIKKRYEEVILADSNNCMGSFVFLWGQKQERTPSWYGLFTENGERTESVNMIEYLWTGKWPENMAPKMMDFTIEGKGGRFDNVCLEKNQEFIARISIEHPNKENLSVRAEIIPEPKELSEGGDFEKRSKTIEGLIISANTSEVIFNAPSSHGAYRIFVYVVDNQNNAATANIPFFVK
ncbi:MAG: hypothetical protein V2I46_12800 [Bacteroides sp.]|nr:hypothetical protein [Bacteroides sp.]